MKDRSGTPNSEPEVLAIDGGPKAMSRDLPYRRLFGQQELAAVEAVFHDSWERQQDFGFQGRFEDAFTDAFCAQQGGGYADAVATGTAAVLVAVAALELVPGAEVVVSPVTDPGCIAPLLMLGLKVVVADAAPGSYNVDCASFARAITPETRAAVLTHVGGIPLEIDALCDAAADQGIPVIEDCSQAHGARWRGRRVGTFGKAGVFSTMFSKGVATGGCGGVVYTGDEEFFWRMRAVADRGKPFDAPDFAPKDPATFLFPAMNLNLDEISCAIGSATLARLEATMERRREITALLAREAAGISGVGLCQPPPPEALTAPFFFTLLLDTASLGVPKINFGSALAAEGIPNNSAYNYVVADWPWMAGHMAPGTKTPNATAFRDTSFNLLLNERFDDDDVLAILAGVAKVVRGLAK